MKNKIIILIIALLAFSSFAYAIIAHPTNLTIIVNSQSSDGLFNFKIQQADHTCYFDNETMENICSYTGDWYDIGNLSLQTENLTSSQSFLWTNYTQKYRITQDENDSVKLNT